MSANSFIVATKSILLQKDVSTFQGQKAPYDRENVTNFSLKSYL
jgi:hypothetical protein